MAQINFDELTYRKPDIDAKDIEIKNYVDVEVAKKVDLIDVGGSNGVMRLINGKILSNYLTFATSIEASEGINTDVIMNPALVAQEINKLQLLINDLEARIIALENI